ncbi:hypothetical protein VN97_g726, partial [Penicillium thymicola]
SDIKGNMS